MDINELTKHIHVTHNVARYKKSCKFWLEPEIELDQNKKVNFSNTGLREMEQLIHENKELLVKQLNLFYAGVNVKAVRK